MSDLTPPPLQPTDPQQPQLTPQSIGYLLTTAKWGKFMAILGFITVAFMIIAGLLLSLVFSFLGDKIPAEGGVLTAIRPALLSTIYIILGIIALIPVIYLNSFSNNISKAVRNNDTDTMTKAFRRLKNLFTFLGVYTIVIIALYIIGIIIFASAALLAV